MREVAEHINGFHRYLLSEDGKDHLIYAAASLGAMLGMEAAEKGKRCFNRMTAELSETMHHWSLEREKPNTKLWNSVQAILNNLDNIVPTPEKIKAIVNSTGLLTGEDAWEKMLHYVRNEITDRFIAIDDVLEEETRQFKCSLVRTLYQELRQLSSNEADGGSQDEDCDMIEWLKTMMDEILTGNEKYAQIRKGFDFLYRFEFNTARSSSRRCGGRCT